MELLKSVRRWRQTHEGVAPAEAVLDAIDDFAWHQQWMMNVGDVKGQILDVALGEALRLHPSGSFTALELGTYLGYSAVRVARRLPPTGSLYSVESDLQSQTVARQVLELAQLLERVTLLAGTAEAQTAELRRRRLQFAFVFIDHKKQDYLPALRRLEDAGLLRPKAVVVADNVGLMEINDYAEHVRSSGSYLSASVASEVEYFTEDERGPLSDAMEVSVYLGENSQRELAADSSQLDPSRWDFSGGASSVQCTTLVRE